MELKIYNQSGELKLTVDTSSSSTLNQELMTENAVSASFTHPKYVPLDVNDYVMLLGVKFSIKKEYKPKQKNTQTYDYSVKFYAPEHDAQQVMYLNLTDDQYNPQFSLDGSPREHMQKWVDNMNRIYGSALWSIGDVVVADNQTIEYNNVSCWDALTSISEAFGTEWWADGFVMNLSRCERGEQVELGCIQGLTSLTQSENSNDVKFFTRLIPLGSTKNIDASRYGFSRLQLPDKAKYVDRNTHYGLYEHVEEAAFAEIFPHYTGSVTAVRSEEKTGEDKKSFTVYYFKDSGMTFDPCENEIGGLVKHVSFQTGDLGGRDFEANYNSTTKEWEIINTYPSDDVQIPGGNLIPAVGNKYIPWNFRMPESYERQAELDYKAAVDDFLAKYSDDVSKYGGDTDYIYIDKNKVSLSLGQRVRLLSDKYFAASEGYRDTRLTKVVRKLDNLSIANIECTNQVGKGWKKTVDSDITQLQYIVNEKWAQTVLDVLKTWDTREPSNYTVFSSLRSRAEHLSKKYPDETKYLMRFLAGLEAGDFKQGSTGVGIYQDKVGNWHMETDYMHVRMKFTAKEVEIQRVLHIGGAQIKTAASMKCICVEELADVYRCYMNTSDEEGNVIFNEYKVNDQAYVQTFNLEKQADGLIGNHFLWRLVSGIGKDYIDLSKTVGAAGSDAPRAGDSIVQLGYRGTDDPNRQCAVIDAGAGEGAPYYRQYVGINSFSLPKPETQLKPGNNEFTGKVNILPGSTGFENVSGMEFGKVNLLRNSGFTGDYNSAKLEENTELEAETDLYSQALKFWAATNATVNVDATSQSGRSVKLNTGILVQTLYYKMISGEKYIISFKAKGTSVSISCAGLDKTEQLTSGYQKYVYKLEATSDTEFTISGICTVCELQLERGTVPSEWSMSPLDNSSAEAKFEALKYLTDVIREGSTTFIGGLGLLSMILVGNYVDGEMKQVTGGLSGVYNDGDDPLLWGDGDLEKAIRTVMACKDNPMVFLDMTEEELADYAKIVFTHGGRAILNDVILRGYVYALGGVFKGKVTQGNGLNVMEEDGSVSFAGGKIRWGVDGKPIIEGKVTTSMNGQRIIIDPGTNSIMMYNSHDDVIGEIRFIDSEWNGTHLYMPRIRLKQVYVDTGGTSSDKAMVDISPNNFYMYNENPVTGKAEQMSMGTNGIEFFSDGVVTKSYPAK